MIQERTKPRFTFPERAAATRENPATEKWQFAGIEQWIQQHPQAAFFGAVFLGVSLAWVLKTRK